MPVSRVGDGLFRSRKVYNPFRKIPPPTLPLTLFDLVFGKPLPWPTPSPRSLLFGRLVPCQVLSTHISWNPCHARSNEWPESLVFAAQQLFKDFRVDLCSSVIHHWNRQPSSPTHFHLERIGLIRVTFTSTVSNRVNKHF